MKLTPGATFDENNNEIKRYWPDFVLDNILTLREDHSWLYLEKGGTYQNSCKVGIFKAITKADQILAKGTWQFDEVNKRLTLIPDPNYETYFYSFMPYGRNGRESVVLSGVEKGNTPGSGLLFAQVDHFFALKGYNESAHKVCSSYGPLLLSSPDVEDKETGQGGIVMQRVTYDAQGQESDYEITQAELENSAWLAKVFQVAAEPPC